MRDRDGHERPKREIERKKQEGENDDDWDAI